MGGCPGGLKGGSISPSPIKIRTMIYKDYGEQVFKDRRITGTLDAGGSFNDNGMHSKLSHWDKVVRLSKDVFAVRNENCRKWHIVQTQKIY